MYDVAAVIEDDESFALKTTTRGVLERNLGFVGGKNKNLFIAFAVLGSVILVTIICTALVCYRKRKRKRRRDAERAAMAHMWLPPIDRKAESSKLQMKIPGVKHAHSPSVKRSSRRDEHDAKKHKHERKEEGAKKRLKKLEEEKEVIEATSPSDSSPTDGEDSTATSCQTSEASYDASRAVTSGDETIVDV